MTDQDRGAYTPHNEAPLAFDPRGPRDRRPAPMTLIASAAVLVVLIAAVFMALRHGARTADAPPPSVGAPVGQIKTAAAGPQPREPGAGLDVYAAQNVPANAAPSFAPSPEQPAPRPVASAAQLQVKGVTPAPVVIEPPGGDATPVASGSTVIHAGAADASAPVQTLRTPVADAPMAPVASAARANAPRTVATAAATTATIDAALARSSPSRRVVARTPASAEPAEAGSIAPVAKGPAGVQIGAFSSAALADKGYADVGAMMGAAMSGRGKSVTALQKGDATLYRTVITGFSDHAAAKAFCAALNAKGHACIVKG